MASLKIFNQVEFSSLLFDTMFGLIIFFAVDSFLDINSVSHFVLYLSSFIITVHWWLIFKSADDLYREEVTNSAADLVFGIIMIIFIQYIIFAARDFNLHGTIFYLLILLAVDLIWTIAWRVIGHWQTKNKPRIRMMESELNHGLTLSFIGLFLFLALLFLLPSLALSAAVAIFVTFYVLFVILSFYFKIIDIKIF